MSPRRALLTAAFCLFAFSSARAADPRLRLGSPHFRHGGSVTSLKFLDDGKTLVSTASDNRVRFWDAATGKETRPAFAPNGYTFGGVAVSPDGKLLAHVGSDRLVAVVDAATGNSVGHFPSQPPNGFLTALAFSRDGKTLAARAPDRALYLWDTAGGKEPRVLGKTPSAVGYGYTAFDNQNRMAFAPDGKLLAVVDDWSIRLWDIAEGKEIRWLGGHLGPVSSIAFTPDGKRLVSLASDRGPRVWDVATGKTVARLSFNLGFPSCLALTADGKTIATTGGDRTIRLWNISDGKLLSQFMTAGQYATALAFAPDGKILFAGGSDQVIRPYDVATGKELMPATGHVGGLSATAYSPDGKTLAAGGTDRVIILWDTASGKARRTLVGHEMAVTRLAFAADGKTLLSFGLDRTIRTWDVAEGRELRQFVAAPANVVSVAFSADARSAVVFGSDNAFRVWDVAGETEKAVIDDALPPNYGSTLTAALDGDGRTVIGLAGDRVLRLWDVATGKEAGRVSLAPPTVPSGNGFAVSADGRCLALPSASAPLLLELASGKERQHFLPTPAPASPTPRGVGVSPVLALSPDGRTVATTSRDGSMRLWDGGGGKEIAAFPATSSGAARTLTFSPDGKSLAAACADSTVLIWDVPGSEAAGRLAAKEAAETEKDALWADLGGDDAAKAYQAVRALAATPRLAVPLLRDRLKPDAPFDAAQIPKLLADLDADGLDTRERATRELVRAGKLAEEAVRKALAAGPSVEARTRLELVRRESALGRPQTADVLRGLRAVEALERIDTPEAKKVLEAVAGGSAGTRLTLDARAALRRLAAP